MPLIVNACPVPSALFAKLATASPTSKCIPTRGSVTVSIAVAHVAGYKSAVINFRLLVSLDMSM